MALAEVKIDQLSRDGGVALAAAAVLSIGLMMNHPTSAHADAAGATVHGGMIVALAALLFGFLAFARAREPSAPVLAGVVAYAISTGAHVLAATINGFAVPALAIWPEGPPSHDVFLFAWQLNQSISAVGIIATGLAYLAWAVALRRDHPLLAIGGAMAGATPATLLLAGIIRLDVHGALLAYGFHGLWALAVGVMMMRGRLVATS